MHIHILGICGTFMGSLALLAKAAGHTVTGCDQNVYPPMSTQLEDSGISLVEGFSAQQLDLNPDLFVIGNVVARGNELMEAILDRGLAYTSGPQWLSENILRKRWVLAVAGTHGKTTTSSMLTWILQYAGMQPGYLIGGVPGNFSQSSSLGGSDFFVIEADEYDTAFFDKRSKFVHYHPRTLVFNNLEYDHADIFPDLASIQRQFHHAVRLVPSNGMVLSAQQSSLEEVINMGCWSSLQWMSGERVGGSAGADDESIDEESTDGDSAGAEDSAGVERADWQVQAESQACDAFNVLLAGQCVGSVCWDLTGQHNMFNALSAIAAARHVGVEPLLACEALEQFKGVERRMEVIGEVDGVRIYDDFAHHPTAIATTLQGLRAKVGDEPISVVLEPRSNTMKQGVHKAALLESIAAADHAYWFQADAVAWDLAAAVEYQSNETRLQRSSVCRSTQDIIDNLIANIGQQKHIVIMSNGGFEGIHSRLLQALNTHKIDEKS